MEKTYEMTQAKAARLAGFLWVLTMITSMVATLYGFSRHVVAGDVAKTAANIMANETSFRAGIAIFLFTSLGVIVLIWAFYILLRPVNRELALIALLFRLAECVILCIMPIQQLVTLKYLSNATYLKVFEPDQLYALANLSMSTYGSGVYVGFVCLGLGSIVFAYLFLKSGYVPKAFAWLGIFASVLLALGSFAVIVFPDIRWLVYPYGMVPMFLYEVGFGFWLWIKGVKIDEPK
jgi:hypothetical protein